MTPHSRIKLLSKVFVACAIAFAWEPCWARYYDLYRADYIKGAFCSVIGGACASDIDFDNSFFQNPASLTAGGGDWDYDYDSIAGTNLEPGMKAGNDVSDSTFMAGVAYATKKIGIGFSFLRRRTHVSAIGTFSDDVAGGQVQFQTSTNSTLYQLNMPVSAKFNKSLDVGVTLSALFSSIQTEVSGASSSAANSPQQPGATFGLTAGAIYRLDQQHIIGAWLRSPLTYYLNQNLVTQSAFTRFNYSESMALHQPLLVALGGGWTPWKNKKMGAFMDLNIVGTTQDGYLLTYDNFASAEESSRLVHKGRWVVVDPRLGLRLPLFGGDSNQTLSLGSYYESSRWQGIPGLFHATAGFAWKFPRFQFLIFDGVELMVGGDYAQGYSSFFFTYR